MSEGGASSASTSTLIHYRYPNLPEHLITRGHQLLTFKRNNPSQLRSRTLKAVLDDFVVDYPPPNRNIAEDLPILATWLTSKATLDEAVKAFINDTRPYRTSPTPEEDDRDDRRSQRSRTEEIGRSRDSNPFPPPHCATGGQSSSDDMAPLTNEQLDQIRAIVQEVVGSIQPPTGPPGPRGAAGPVGPPGPAGADGNGGGGGLGHFRPQEIGYFQPDLEKLDKEKESGDYAYVGSDTYIRDVQVFVDRARDVAGLRGENVVISSLPSCLRGTALTWYTSSLTEVEKRGLRASPLNDFLDMLVKQFKEPTSVSLRHVTAAKYSLEAARANRRA